MKRKQKRGNRRGPQTRNLAWFAILWLCLWGAAAQAHVLRPSVVKLTLDGDSGFTLTIKSVFEARIAGVGPQHSDTREAPEAQQYDALRELPAAVFEDRLRAYAQEFIGHIEIQIAGKTPELTLTRVRVPASVSADQPRLSTLTFSGKLPQGERQLVYRFPAAFGDSVFSLAQADKPDDAPVSHWLQAGASPLELILGSTSATAAGDGLMQYVYLGVIHIVPAGLDHILFVLGLFLLSSRWSPLLWQVTAFTLAHTLTLVMSMYGAISLSPSIVEPLIAASIVYVGIENVLHKRLGRTRLIVVFVFGLLHGMGFAGVLSEIGLPESQFFLSLIAFNVGVEVGQLLVLAGAFLFLLVPLGRQSWYRNGVVVPGSLMIALVGAYWFFTRI